MADMNNSISRYFDQLGKTGFSADAMKMFVLCMIDEWKDEILQCDHMYLTDINRLFNYFDGSSCVFGYDKQC